MPFISMDVNVPLDEGKKLEIKSELGALISLLPGKTEGVLMVAIRAAGAMYFRGDGKPCAFVDVRLYRQSEFAAKKEFVRALSRMIERQTGIREADIFITISEFDHWGTNGNLI